MTAKRERIYIIFHWAGLVFIVLVLLIFAMGFVFLASRGLSQSLGIALVVAGVVALIQSNENLRGVEITGCRVAPVEAGQQAELELTLQNFSDRERVGLEVRKGWKWKDGRWGGTGISAWLPVLDAKEIKSVRLEIPTTRRGRYPVPILWVCTVMPMGLCFAWKNFRECGEYFVYPAPRGLPLELAPLARNETGAKQKLGGEDVSGHRPYELGDMLSRMDWRVFARSGKLVVRTLEESGAEEVDLRLEDTRFLADDERRLEQLSFWISQCLHEGRAFTLSMGSGRMLHSSDLARCLEALATFQSRP